jgi:hypothetical protein
MNRSFRENVRTGPPPIEQGRRPATFTASTGRIPSSGGPWNRARLLQRLFLSAFIVVGLTIPATAGTGNAPSRAMQSLDQQVQDIKSDVLAITAELRGLEEQLLYPSNTQVAIFVSLADDKGVAFDSARISIDGELVTHHIYSWKELEALKKGGVQRIYTGNVSAGEHSLEVEIRGKRGGGADYDTVEKFTFRKEVDPKNVGIVLDSGLTGSATIEIANW